MVITIITSIIFVLSILIFTVQFICLAELDRKNNIVEFVIRLVNTNSFIKEIVLKIHPIVYFILFEVSIIVLIINVLN